MPDIYIGSEEELLHYGVKGMKWGVTKKNSRYSEDRVSRDVSRFGRKGVKEINEDLDGGKTYKQAVNKQFVRRRESQAESVGWGLVAASGAGQVAHALTSKDMLVNLAYTIGKHGQNPIINRAANTPLGVMAFSALLHPGAQSIIQAGATALAAAGSGALIYNVSMLANGYAGTRAQDGY